jgi:hypothetical protein
MLKMDVIEAAMSPWSSHIVLIPNPDVSIRFCKDYRKLNAATEKDSYALPRIDDCYTPWGVLDILLRSMLTAATGK